MSTALALRVWNSRLMRPFRERSQRRQAELAASFAELETRQDDLRDRLDRQARQVSRTLATVQRLEARLTSSTHGPDGNPTDPTGPALDGLSIAMAPDFPGFMDQVADNYQDLAAPFDDYRTLVSALADRRTDMDLLPVSVFADRRPGPTDPSVIALRHDIDADPVTGLRCARHLAREGVPGTFYLLPTAGYYGRYEHGRFLRNPDLVRWVRGFIVAGAELGIHNDALGLSATGLVDGSEALRAELDWLRQQAAVITTTAGHNSAPSQGAENLEVFNDRVLWERSPDAPTPPGLPLGVLDEAELGLTSEGTFALPRAEPDVAAAEAFCRTPSPGIRDAGWMRRYLLDNPCLEWDVDLQVWLVGRDEWIVGGRPRTSPSPAPQNAIHEHLIGFDRVLEILDAHRHGNRILFVLHPAYVRGEASETPSDHAVSSASPRS